MALVRHWYPTGNKSSRSKRPRLLVIHTTEGFTGPNGMYDCAIYFQGPVGASSHVVIDNYHPGHICECVSADYASWTQCNYNGDTAASVEQCGYASWSRATWLNEKMPLLENVAAWLAEESNRWGIPLTDLTSSQAQGSGTGVCYHSDLGNYGCGHSDPGSGYPLDVVLDMARGTTPTPKPPEPEPEEDDMPYFEIPPKSQRAQSSEISLDGMFSTVGMCTDAGTREDSTELRVAAHIGQGNWATAHLYSDRGKEKQVLTPGGKFDGLRIDRIDDNDTFVTINVGR